MGAAIFPRKSADGIGEPHVPKKFKIFKILSIKIVFMTVIIVNH